MFDEQALATLTVIIGGGFAVVVSVGRMMSEWSTGKLRPTMFQIFGRVIVAFGVGYLVGGFIQEFFSGWNQNLLWGVCGFFGFIGELGFYSLASLVEKQYNVTLLETPKLETPKLETPKEAGNGTVK